MVWQEHFEAKPICVWIPSLEGCGFKPRGCGPLATRSLPKISCRAVSGVQARANAYLKQILRQVSGAVWKRSAPHPLRALLIYRPETRREKPTGNQEDGGVRLMTSHDSGERAVIAPALDQRERGGFPLLLPLRLRRCAVRGDSARSLAGVPGRCDGARLEFQPAFEDVLPLLR